MTYKLYKIFLALVVCSFLSVGAFAQNANSSINGTVKDTHGAVVSGATVTLTDIGTNQPLTTTSSTDGFYTFSNLSPANYKLNVSAPGFADFAAVLTLRVSQTAPVDAILTAASVSTQVTVKDVTPVIDSVDPTLADVKNATAIETIPVLNRNILNVLAFSPGVVANSYGGSGAGNTRVNGVPGGSMDYLIDGQTATNRFTNELEAYPQPTPTYQEVKIITSNGSAQYTRPGLVELVTKSGTNQFHGQAFELNRNNHLTARPYNSANTVPFLQHNEWGAQLGGPVWIPKIYNGRDKTFFFFDAEWIQENSNSVQQFIFPTQAMRTGNEVGLFGPDGHQLNIYDPLSTTADGFSPYDRTQFSYNGVANVIPPNRLNPVTQKILGITSTPGLIPLPEPNVNQPNYWQYLFNYSAPHAANTTREKTYTAKVDQVFGPNRLAARYTYVNNNITQPYLPLNPNVRNGGGHNGSLTFTKVIGPRMINVAHIGIQYNSAFSGPAPISPPVTQVLGLPTYTNTIAWPSFYFNGLGGAYLFSGIDRNNPKNYPDSAISGSDQFTYNRGNHQLMFGFEVTNNRLTTYEVGQPGGGYNYSGNFSALLNPTGLPGTFNNVPDTGSGLVDFLLGETDSVNLNIYPDYHTRQTEYSGFAQDDWRISQKLTLNLGVRYEYWTAFADATGLQSTLDPNIPGGMVVYQGGGQPAQTDPAVLASFRAAGLPIESAAMAKYPLSLWNMPKNNFEPRVGFAYQLNDKTVLRGGYGIYHFVIPLQTYEQAARKNPPFSYSAFINPGEIYTSGTGVGSNATAAELEFPIASATFGGPCIATNPNCTTPNFFMLGNNSTLILNTSNTSISQGGGFGIAPMDPNYKASMVQEYNLSFARELPWHTGAQISYIGNHSTNLLMNDPLNYTIPRDLCASEGATDVAQCEGGIPQFQRAFPVFATSGGGNQELYEYNGYANTNELQAQLTHTWGNGLTIQSYFTWQRTLTTSEFGNNGAATPYGSVPGNNVVAAAMIPAALTPGYNLANYASGAATADRLRAVYSNDPTLPDKTFQLNAHYVLPFGKGQRYLGNAHGIVNALVSGYSISPFFLWHSGFFFSPYSTQFSMSSVGGPGGGRGIFLAPGKTGILPESQRNVNHWFDYSVWDPTLGTPYNGQTYEYTSTSVQGDYRNNIPFNYMTGPGFNNLDASVYKVTPLWRNLVFDFEAQVFNIYNHQNLGMPNSQGFITAPVATPGPRSIQLQGKFVF